MQGAVRQKSRSLGHEGDGDEGRGAVQTQKITESPKIGLLIIDEAHHFRNPETISSKYAFDICRSSENRVIMTATPLQNGIDDLVTILNLVLCHIPSSVINAVVIEALGTGNGEILYPLMILTPQNKLKFYPIQLFLVKREL